MEGGAKERRGEERRGKERESGELEVDKRRRKEQWGRQGEEENECMESEKENEWVRVRAIERRPLALVGKEKKESASE
jgi:hypothetical protein